MQLQPLVPALVAALIASSAVMTYAASIGGRALSLGAALVFAAVLIGAAILTNRPLWYAPRPQPADAVVTATRRNARVMALTHAWGAVTLYAVYSLSGLWWFHGWQYGLAMALVAAGLIGYVHQLGDRESPLRQPRSLDIAALLAAVQALAAAAGVGFLVSSGKLATLKTDWPANHVFLAGGILLVGASLIAALTHWRIRGRAN